MADEHATTSMKPIWTRLIASSHRSELPSTLLSDRISRPSMGRV